MNNFKHHADHIEETSEKQFISQELKDLIGKCDTGGGTINYIETFEQLKEAVKASSGDLKSDIHVKPGCTIKFTETLYLLLGSGSVFDGHNAVFDVSGLDVGLDIVMTISSQFKNVNFVSKLQKGEKARYTFTWNNDRFRKRAAVELNTGLYHSRMFNCRFDVNDKMALYHRTGMDGIVDSCSFTQSLVSISGMEITYKNCAFSDSYVIKDYEYEMYDIKMRGCHFERAFIDSALHLYDCNIFTSSIISVPQVKYVGIHSNYLSNPGGRSIIQNCVFTAYSKILLASSSNVMLEMSNCTIVTSDFEFNFFDETSSWYTYIAKKLAIDPDNLKPQCYGNNVKEIVLKNNISFYANSSSPLFKLRGIAEYTEMVGNRNVSILQEPIESKVANNGYYMAFPLSLKNSFSGYFSNKDQCISHLFNCIKHDLAVEIIDVIKRENSIYKDLNKISCFFKLDDNETNYNVYVYFGKDIEFNDLSSRSQVKNCKMYKFTVPFSTRCISNSINFSESRVIGDQFEDMILVSDDKYEPITSSANWDYIQDYVQLAKQSNVGGELKIKDCNIKLHPYTEAQIQQRKVCYEKITINNSSISTLPISGQNDTYTTGFVNLNPSTKSFIITNSTIKDDFGDVVINCSDDNCKTLMSEIVNENSKTFDEIFSCNEKAMKTHIFEMSQF